MCSDFAIKVENVGKRYEMYATPRDRLKQFIFPRIRRWTRLPAKNYFEEFWALRDVSFAIKKGETLGIIGKNGSGKSTLLQMICGVLNPSMGNVSVHGRIAALLELGSGFNPEFTGRENIYMNAAVLGLSRDEIDERYQEIIDFADIGDFINRPVKMYSSGMYVRLAFSIAINVVPEILVVDEALAVGDAGFQHKCALRMQQMQENGVTILFVSHDTTSVVRLCDRAILLDAGRVVLDSTNVLDVVRNYEALTRNVPSIANEEKEEQDGQIAEPLHEIKAEALSYAEELGGISERRLGTGGAEFLSVEFLDSNGTEKGIFEAGERITIKATIKSKEFFPAVVSGFTLKTVSGLDVWGDNTLRTNPHFTLSPGITQISYTFNLHINAGYYFLYIGLGDISGSTRVELDQRWPVRKLTVSTSIFAGGFLFSPAAIDISPINDAAKLKS